MNNNKTFQVINKEKTTWVVIRQIVGLDKIYVVGNRIPGYGQVIAIR